MLVAMLLVAAASLIAPAAASALERSEVDRPDDYPGPHQAHVMYVVPSDRPDMGFDTDGTIAASVDSWQRWMRGQTGGPGIVLDTFNGELDITFARLPLTEAELEAMGNSIIDGIDRELTAMGRLTPGKIYAIHYDGDAEPCGNANVVTRQEDAGDPGHQLAVIYLGACPDETWAGWGQPPGYREYGVIHEIVHVLGFVQPCASNYAGSPFDGHVGDSPTDLMYAGNEGWVPSVLDVNRDDYFLHGRDDCPDLADSFFLEGQKPAKTKKPRKAKRPQFEGNKVVFRFKGKGAASFECRVDEGEWEDCSSPAKLKLRKLGRGKHLFESRAVSAAGIPDPTPLGWKFKLR